MRKTIFTYKVDTTGLVLDSAFEYIEKYKVRLVDQLKLSYSEEEMKNVVVLAIPGDHFNVTVQTVVYDNQGS